MRSRSSAAPRTRRQAAKICADLGVRCAASSGAGVEFLADPESSYITGQVYPVNGGLYM